MALELDAINLSTATQADLGLSGMDFQANGLGQVQPDGSLQLAGNFGWTIMRDSNGNPLGVLQTPTPGYDFQKDGLPKGSSVQSVGPGQMIVHDAYGKEIGWLNANPMDDGSFPNPWGSQQVVAVNGATAPDGYFALNVEPTQLYTATAAYAGAQWVSQDPTPVVATGNFAERQ